MNVFQMRSGGNGMYVCSVCSVICKNLQNVSDWNKRSKNKLKNVKCSTFIFKLFCYFWIWKLLLPVTNFRRYFGDFKFEHKIRIIIIGLVSHKVRRRFFVEFWLNQVLANRVFLFIMIMNMPVSCTE